MDLRGNGIHLDDMLQGVVGLSEFQRRTKAVMSDSECDRCLGRRQPRRQIVPRRQVAQGKHSSWRNGSVSWVSDDLSLCWPTHADLPRRGVRKDENFNLAPMTLATAVLLGEKIVSMWRNWQ